MLNGFLAARLKGPLVGEIANFASELVPQPMPSLNLPNPAWPAEAEAKIKDALKDSHKRTLLGRG